MPTPQPGPHQVRLRVNFCGICRVRECLRTLYNVNRRDSEEFLGLAREIDLSLGTEVFPFPALQEGMIRQKRGEIQEANAAVRISEEGDGGHQRNA